MWTVVKRDGRREPFRVEKLAARITKQCYGLDTSFVSTQTITDKVAAGMCPDVTTAQIDELATETAAYRTTEHPDYAKLAARLAVTTLHKHTNKVFSDNFELFRANKHEGNGTDAPKVAEDVYAIVMQHKDQLNAAIVYDRDFEYDYFGYKTLEKTYLFRVGGKVVERPQQMLMRVAVGIHKHDIAAAIESYDLMSRGFFSHATPTLFNAGTPRPQLSSCFLLPINEDSIDGIYEKLTNCARITKWSGGIGVSVHNIRATDSYISGIQGHSTGLVPTLRVFNNASRQVKAGRRAGAFAMYLEPWHADVYAFLELKKNHGNEMERARDLFYALWISDLFMKRVKANAKWTLFCPNDAPGLFDTWGAKHEELYVRYENEGRGRSTVDAQHLWFAILKAQIETGTPYMLYKDACNGKSNHQHLGTIRSSNLCCEVVEYSAPDEVAVCNLASIALPKFVAADKTFDFEKLYEVAKLVTRNLNKVIDINYYPVVEAKTSNTRHRPIGVGVQGLADAFLLMGYAFESDQARALNKDIFETLYFAAMEASMELAREHGPYASYEGSPVSKGVFQFDMWGVTPTSGRWDWAELRANVKRHGIRNSLLIAPMPTASTAQILGNNESFEPFTTNMYTRRVAAGDFTVVNKHLIRELAALGLWTADFRNRDQGSVQNMDELPQHLRDKYKTVWEIKQRVLLDMAADRGAFVCQSQSLNVHIAEPTYANLSSMHFHGWSIGLKTGMYYLRTRPKADAIQFTVDQAALQRRKASLSALPNRVQEPEDEEECVACSA